MQLTTLLREIGIKPSLRGKGLSKSQCVIKKFSQKYPRGYWYDVLDEAKRAYKNKVRIMHPDRGGSTAACARLNAVYSMVKKRLEPLLEWKSI